MSSLLERLLQACTVPWRRRASLLWSLVWGATYVTAMATVIALSLNEPAWVICKRLLALHVAFAFSAFFGTAVSPEQYPRVMWERVYAASASLFCLMLLVQAAFAFSGVQWSAAWIVGGGRAATNAGSEFVASMSLAFGLVIYLLTAIETEVFRRFLLRLQRRPIRPR